MTASIWSHIDESDSDQMRDVPHLPAYHWTAMGAIDQWSIWCPSCDRWHTHGGLGHRFAHCDRPADYPTGYVLIDSGHTTTEEQVERNEPPASIAAEPRPTTLYRLFALDGTLLYIGIAGNPGRRFEQHAGEKAWWGQVARITLEHFATRNEAADAERTAIRHERPAHNVTHAVRP